MNINWQSTSVKLTLLLGVTIILLVGFLIAYSKTYIRYYLDLYNYRQDLVDKLTTKEIKKPTYSPNDIALGNPKAKIVIFEYSDFSCEACKQIQKTMIDLVDFYGQNNILYIFKDLPASTNENNLLAHQAAHCAHDQNAFSAYKLTLYDHQGAFEKPLLIDYAKDLKLDEEKFTQCLEEERYKQTVLNNLNDALKLQLTGVPTLFINNQEVANNFTFNNLRGIIEQSK
ncbi:thioredoxin domain-containing protein [Candidatus Falkowbacteria bacterium]|nr:thioredoxin domain-containing protein [Candidatus Falkowbacteria bacterium]